MMKRREFGRGLAGGAIGIGAAPSLASGMASAQTPRRAAKTDGRIPRVDALSGNAELREARDDAQRVVSAALAVNAPLTRPCGPPSPDGRGIKALSFSRREKVARSDG